MLHVAEKPEGIVAVKVTGPDGREIVVVAVRPAVLDDDARRDATLAVLRSVFPRQTVALATSTSGGVRVASDSPEIESGVSKRIKQKRPSLDWQRYSLAL